MALIMDWQVWYVAVYGGFALYVHHFLPVSYSSLYYNSFQQLEIKRKAALINILQPAGLSFSRNSLLELCRRSFWLVTQSFRPQRKELFLLNSWGEKIA